MKKVKDRGERERRLSGVKPIGSGWVRSSAHWLRSRLQWFGASWAPRSYRRLTSCIKKAAVGIFRPDEARRAKASVPLQNKSGRMKTKSAGTSTKLEPKWQGHFGNMIPTAHCLLSASSTQVQNIQYICDSYMIYVYASTHTTYDDSCFGCSLRPSWMHPLLPRVN